MKTAMAIRLTDEPESKSAKAYDGSDKTQESTAPISQSVSTPAGTILSETEKQQKGQETRLKDGCVTAH